MSQVERFSSETEGSFDSWLKARGIQVALLDLDGTLIKTTTTYGTQEALYFEFCQSRNPEMDIEEFKLEFERISRDSYELNGVSPKSLDYTISKLCERYNIESFREGSSILHAVYQMAPEPFDRTTETLDLFQKCNIRLGLVTHASKPWTDIKLDAHGLRRHFEHISTIDPDEHIFKSEKHWSEAIAALGVSPDSTMVIGDSLKSDIGPAWLAGVTNLVWVHSPWKLANEGDIPLGTIEVSGNIGNLIPTLIGQI